MTDAVGVEDLDPAVELGTVCDREPQMIETCPVLVEQSVDRRITVCHKADGDAVIAGQHGLADAVPLDAQPLPISQHSRVPLDGGVEVADGKCDVVHTIEFRMIGHPTHGSPDGRGRGMLATRPSQPGARMSHVSYLLRVYLQDRPGSLGLLAVQLGSVGADILSLEVVERGEGYAVDDLVVEVARGALPDSLITAAEKVKGVRVDSIRPYSGVLDTHRELELVDQVATTATDRLQVLVDQAPRVLRVSWAMILTQGVGGGVLQLFGSSGAPETPLTRADWLPLNRAEQLDPDADWVPEAWQDMDTRMAAAPLGSSGKAILLGRIGGPDFRPSEIARLGYLAGIVSTVLRAEN